MPHHRIRLRAAWERLDSGSSTLRRVDLPIVWAAEDRLQPFTLRRGFGRPARNDGLASFHLQVADAPGITAVRVNGQTIAGPMSTSLSLALTGLVDRRNLIEIDVDLASSQSSSSEQPWGEVALVIAEE